LRIVIIGKGPGKENAPLKIDDGELWGLNDLIIIRRVDVTFEMHDLDVFNNPIYHNSDEWQTYISNILEYVKDYDIPIYTQRYYDWVPNCIPFPFDEMPVDLNYFTSTIAYMIALAITKKPDIIEIYGIPLVLREEYQDQRPCIEFWLGYAVAEGVEIIIHEPSVIMSDKTFKGLYGIEGTPLKDLYVINT